MYGHPDVVSEANRRFNLSATDANISSVRAGYRSIIFRTIISNGSRKEYEAVLAEYLTSKSVDGKEIALQSLGFVKQPHLIEVFLSFLFSDEVAVQDIHLGLSGVTFNPVLRLQIWTYIKNNWNEPPIRKLKLNPVILERFLSLILPSFADHSIEKDIISFFKDKDVSEYNRALAVAVDTIRANATYKNRSVQELSNWLTGNGYA